MTSHGVPRVTEVEPRTEQAKQKELKKIEDYRTLVDLVNLKIQERDFTFEVLNLTSKLLTLNPEYYTIWNHRRRILNHHFTQPNKENPHDPPDVLHQSITSLINDDLTFTFPLLLKYPKCYWIWLHRQHLLQTSTRLLPPTSSYALWNSELVLTSKMLSRDARNFHGWGYRRTIVEALESEALNPGKGPKERSMVKGEFEYTTRMIKNNLSNFSAWHARSKLIPRLLDEDGAGEEERRKRLDDEIELITTALYTDPTDQSLWFYHQFLVYTIYPPSSQVSFVYLEPSDRMAYLESLLTETLELLDGAEDCKWIYQALIQLCLLWRRETGDGSWPVIARDGKLEKWMSELRKLDPLRKGRWTDLENELDLGNTTSVQSNKT